ncbi:hypothetical protein D0Z00_000373 [Geotrichum galactomycetum]|uniref:Uncharacterized protein n=1 Tax=Geotrichum galactomycetum TaxID=27317 RepID=A0ACB6V9X1_9ASCO|nr:hypothetical protein D0Z00_000373 [Geotrichum candidum]
MMLQGNFKGLVAEIDLMLPDETSPGNQPSNNSSTTLSTTNNSTTTGTSGSGLTVEAAIDQAREILITTGLLKNPTGPPLSAFVTAPGNPVAAAAAAGMAEFNLKNVVLGPKLKAAAASKAPVTDFSRLDTVAQYVELIS